MGVLDNRVAVITGSGAGIGRATALAMAREGASVVVNDIAAESAEKVAQEIRAAGGKAVAFVGDISDFEMAGRLIKTAVESFGKIDILHNNAAARGHNPIWEYTEKDWDRVIGVDLKGTFNCIRHASPYMMARKWGRIVNASSSARVGTPRNTAYSAAKAGVIGLTGVAARDLISYGITCNAYLPYASTPGSDTPESQARKLQAYKDGHYTKEQYDLITYKPPPETVPPLIIYLCTDDAAKINGQVFDINGDYIAIYTEPYKRATIFKTEGGWTVEELKAAVPRVLLPQG